MYLNSNRCNSNILFIFQVSWVRHRDLHILTIGRYTYVSDQRFQAYHLADTDDWTLQIRYTQPRDAGIYECQVSTEPKMSLIITLNVVGNDNFVFFFSLFLLSLFFLLPLALNWIVAWGGSLESHNPKMDGHVIALLADQFTISIYNNKANQYSAFPNLV